MGPVKDLRFHLLSARSELFREPGARRQAGGLLAAQLLEADELRHVLDAMDDSGDLAALSKDGRIDRAPIPLLEATPLRVGAADVVLLHRHGVGNSLL